MIGAAPLAATPTAALAAPAASPLSAKPATVPRITAPGAGASAAELLALDTARCGCGTFAAALDVAATGDTNDGTNSLSHCRYRVAPSGPASAGRSSAAAVPVGASASTVSTWRGVSMDKESGKWRARIILKLQGGSGRREMALGYYDAPVDAAQRVAAAVYIVGDGRSSTPSAFPEQFTRLSPEQGKQVFSVSGAALESSSRVLFARRTITMFAVGLPPTRPRRARAGGVSAGPAAGAAAGGVRQAGEG